MYAAELFAMANDPKVVKEVFFITSAYGSSCRAIRSAFMKFPEKHMETRSSVHLRSEKNMRKIN